MIGRGRRLLPIPHTMPTKLDDKILSALERIHTASRATMQQAGQDHGLPLLQAQLIDHLRRHPQSRDSISTLADTFAVTAPTMSDSIRVLTGKGLVEKRPAAADRRALEIVLTPEGSALADKLRTYAAPVLKEIRSLQPSQKLALWGALIGLIDQMQTAGLIPLTRMCCSCRHGTRTESGIYCELLRRPLGVEQIRLECPEHEPAA